MWKKVLLGIMAVFMSLFMSSTVYVTAESADADEDYDFGYIMDEAYVLSDEEWVYAEEEAEYTSKQHECSIYAVLLNNALDYANSVDDAALAIYSYYDLGSGEDRNGIILVVSITDRSYYIYGDGPIGERALTGENYEKLENAFLDYFAEDDWYTGVLRYIKEAENCIIDAEEALSASAAEPEVDTEEYAKGRSEESEGGKTARAYGIGFVIALIAAFISCSVMKSSMKTAVPARTATKYLDERGMTILDREDRYTHTTRTERTIQNPSNNQKGAKK